MLKKKDVVTINNNNNQVAFNHNGTLLASGSDDNTIKLWNLETKTEIATL